MSDIKYYRTWAKDKKKDGINIFVNKMEEQDINKYKLMIIDGLIENVNLHYKCVSINFSGRVSIVFRNKKSLDISAITLTSDAILLNDFEANIADPNAFDGIRAIMYYNAINNTQLDWQQS